mgnify:CR=1 FL=1
MGPATLALTMGFARLAGQGIVQRVNPFRLLMGGAVIAACGALGAALATTPAMAYAGFIVMGIGSSVIAPTAFSLVGRLAEPEARARAASTAASNRFPPSFARRVSSASAAVPLAAHQGHASAAFAGPATASAKPTMTAATR